MKPVTVGLTSRQSFETVAADSAAAGGNTGVEAVSSEALIRFIEKVCHGMIADSIEAGEASVGAGFNFVHLAPAPTGVRIDVTGAISKVDHNRIDFDARAFYGTRLLMKGTHRRAVVELEAFLVQIERGSDVVEPER